MNRLAPLFLSVVLAAIYFLVIALAAIGGCPQAKVANYAPDDAGTAYKLARGEASIWDGITADDRAAYERVKRKLNERTDREADNFADAKYKVRE